MGDTRSDFGGFYPAGGFQAAAPAAGGIDAVARARLAEIAAAADGLAELDPDGGEGMAEVKERVNAAVAVMRG